MQATGLIVSSYGRQYIVETLDNNKQRYNAVTRAKKNEYVVGDNVILDLINQEQAQIIELIPRRNLVYRSDRNRSKIIASNINQIIIVCAVKPNFNRGFLDSCLLSAESSGIKPLIVINKIDLAESQPFITEITSIYQQTLGYPIVQLNATDNCRELEPYLANSSSLLIGQSGMGKSTITNTVCPEANTRIGDITKYETSGAHTTTNATLYHLDKNSSIIDCPGLQEFGLFHIELDQLAEYFPEMRNYLGRCKFMNCRHLQEPQCLIRQMVEDGKIDSARYAFYQRIAEALKTKKSY